MSTYTISLPSEGRIADVEGCDTREAYEAIQVAMMAAAERWSSLNDEAIWYDADNDVGVKIEGRWEEACSDLFDCLDAAWSKAIEDAEWPEAA